METERLALKFMKPILYSDLPSGKDWRYEIKYDGFRAFLHLTKDAICLTSKNGKDLTAHFPEITEYLTSLRAAADKFLPVTIDGELAVLNHPYAANFSWIQKRGRLKNAGKIQEAAQLRPASFIAFDIIEAAGRKLESSPFKDRRRQLEDFFSKTNACSRLQLIEQFTDAETAWRICFDHKAEGIVAKRTESYYTPGKQHQDWLKMKNWRRVHCFLTEWDSENDYFTAAVHGGNTGIQNIGKIKHGLDDQSFSALKHVFSAQGTQMGSRFLLPPAVCAEVNTLDLYEGEVREANFARLLPEKRAEDMTVRHLKHDLAMLPQALDQSNPEKIFWPEAELTKEDLVIYIRNMAPYMLPFLKEKALTLIRFPDGIEGESFFQKHLPPYAPETFAYALNEEGEKRIICDQLLPLVWFANHGAIEYHVPFETIGSSHPDEIVFDLDPPDQDHFHLAVYAARLIKQMTDDLGLITFIKTSGSKGLQIHIPLPDESFTYEQTALFTQSIALIVERARPDLFTTERLKKNRKGRLYLDYVQHAPGKTIIAPYSPRRVPEAAVAAPLFWDEVTDDLRPVQFTMKNILERVQLLGCPFANYWTAGEKQDVERLLRLIAPK